MNDSKPSVMNWRILQARKALLQVTNADLAKAAGVCERTVSMFLNGEEAVRPDTQDAIARALGLRRIIDFKTIENDQVFADLVGA